MIYLDHNATSPLRPEAAGAGPGGVVFASGGAETNALALRGPITGAAEAGQPITRLLVQATAHDSVRAVAGSLVETTPGLQLFEIPVDGNGRIDQAKFSAQLADSKGRALVSLIYVNNETGVIEDIAPLIEAIRAEANALIHIDAVSSGYCPIRFDDWDAD